MSTSLPPRTYRNPPPPLSPAPPPQLWDGTVEVVQPASGVNPAADRGGAFTTSVTTVGNVVRITENWVSTVPVSGGDSLANRAVDLVYTPMAPGTTLASWLATAPSTAMKARFTYQYSTPPEPGQITPPAAGQGLSVHTYRLFNRRMDGSSPPEWTGLLFREVRVSPGLPPQWLDRWLLFPFYNEPDPMEAVQIVPVANTWANPTGFFTQPGVPSYPACRWAEIPYAWTPVGNTSGSNT